MFLSKDAVWFVTSMLLSTSTVSAFSVLFPRHHHHTNIAQYRTEHSRLFSAQESGVKSALSEEDRAHIAKARMVLGKSAQKTEEEEPPKLFEDDLLDDMQKVLMLLEKRTKKGAGSIGGDDFDYFEEATAKISESIQNGPPEGYGKPPATTTVAVAPPAPIDPPANPVPQAIQPTSAFPSVAERQSSEGEYGVTDMSDDDGPAFNGSSIGLASGTTNTWRIPGMDEMTPEEYREKLQETVSAAQRERRSKKLVGNKSSIDYLSQLGNSSGGFKAKEVSWKQNNEE